jgi:hypothetical protein
MLSKEVTKKLSKEVTKSLLEKVRKCFLKKSQKAVTATHICRLFTDKKCVKVLQKASQNCDDRLKLAFFGHCDQMRYFLIHKLTTRLARAELDSRFTALITRQKTKHCLQKSIKYINFNIEDIESLNIVYS